MNARDAICENDLQAGVLLSPPCICTRCGEDASPWAGLCDACEDAEASLFLHNNSLPDDAGKPTGDDPRR